MLASFLSSLFSALLCAFMQEWGSKQMFLCCCNSRWNHDETLGVLGRVPWSMLPRWAVSIVKCQVCETVTKNGGGRLLCAANFHASYVVTYLTPMQNFGKNWEEVGICSVVGISRHFTLVVMKKNDHRSHFFNKYLRFALLLSLLMAVLLNHYCCLSGFSIFYLLPVISAYMMWVFFVRACVCVCVCLYRNMDTGMNAIVCYLQACRSQSEAKCRKMMSRILWLLAYDNKDQVCGDW